MTIVHHQHAGPAVRLQGVSAGYHQGVVLDQITLDIPQGCVALIGPNGSGKSTLLKAVVGLVPLLGGQIEVFGVPQAKWDRRRLPVGYVPQLHQLDRAFPVSVAQVVMMGRVGRIGLLRRPGAADGDAVMAALEKVGMADFAQRQIGELSGGQQQRVFIARALAQEARLLLLDEPANGLDLPTQRMIYDLLEVLHGTGLTALTTTHDVAALHLHHFDRIICLNRQVVAAGTPEAVLTPEVLRATYGDDRPLPQVFTSGQVTTYGTAGVVRG